MDSDLKQEVIRVLVGGNKKKIYLKVQEADY
jgi:hypothetical protein